MDRTTYEDWLNSEEASLESWIEGPRWAGIKDFIIRSAIDYDLTWVGDGNYVRENKGLLRTTVYYRVSGRYNDVKRFKKNTLRTMEAYNG